jgi:hypothetical protein
MRRWAQDVARLFATLLSICLVCSVARSPVYAGRPQATPADKPPKGRTLHWSPPLVDSKLRSRLSSPSCNLSDALERAGARANELVTNLQNFTAEEKVEYQSFDRLGYMQDHGSDGFHYVVDVQQGLGAMTLLESRIPTHGSRLSAPAAQDVGLPEIALMFLPEMQADYEMTCEGTTMWGGQVTWVIHFQQRKDKPGRTLAFRGANAVYPAKLKGRVWVSSESGELTHIETALMEEIPLAKVRRWYLSLDYAPIQFRTRKVKISLPQTVDAYCEFEDHRTIVYHTFTNFMLFSVQTDEGAADEKKQP